MSKEEFFQDLEEIITAPVYLTSRTDEVKNEVNSNHWSIGIDSLLVKSIDVSEFTFFLAKVKENRKKQLRQLNADIDLIFYLWFDEFAGNLNFNFINANHRSLPFKADVERVKSETEILEEFLKSKYLDGIPYDELAFGSDYISNEVVFNFKLKVYTELIKR